MDSSTLNILFIADIVGEPGIKMSKLIIPELKEKYFIKFCIANGENLCGGKGLSVKTVEDILDAGVNVITTGNHVWAKDRFIEKLDQYKYVLRPANYPKENVGYGSTIYTLNDNTKIGVLNLQGRVFMNPINCPFKTAVSEINKLRKKTNCIIVDFHAEATAEKVALGQYLDGKISALVGTHTHVQTADEQILPNKSAYITDVGMTGPIDSVIGINKRVAIKRFIYQIPVRYALADGLAMFNGIVIAIDPKTGHSLEIKRLNIKEESFN
ncbi:TIGR00282 family metallophosphoesterase [candidate division KSB1 bacterium]